MKFVVYGVPLLGGGDDELSTSWGGTIWGSTSCDRGGHEGVCVRFPEKARRVVVVYDASARHDGEKCDNEFRSHGRHDP